MPFYGFFVIFQNLDFGALFWPYSNRAEPDIVFDDASTLNVISYKNYKVIRGCWYRITCPLLRKSSFFQKSTKFQPLFLKK